MRYSFVVHVKMNPGVFDPRASTIERNLKKMSYPVEDLKIGKTFEFSLNAESEEKASFIVKEMAEKVLSNPVLEDFTLERVEK